MWHRAFRSFNRLTAVAIAGGLTIALVGETGSHRPNPAPRLASYAVIETAAIKEMPTSVGVAEGSDLYFMSEEDVKLTLKTLKALGVRDVRIGIFWAYVEGTEGQRDWTRVDRVVNAALEEGMGILANVNHTPAWAGDPYLTGHPDPAKYGDFVGAAAERYKGKISAYELWNEPTTSLFWNPVDPVAYTELLKAGYAAVKAADASALVIGGSVVAGPTKEDGSAMDPVSFVAAMYAAGAAGYFDALSYHPYQYTTPFSEGQGKPYFDYPIEQLAAIRQLMVQNGDGDLKVWITEYGEPTVTLADGTVLTQQQQADYIADLVRAWQGVDGAGPVFIYQARDTETGSTNIDSNFGLYETDWTPKLAAAALANLIRELTPVAQPVNPIAFFVQQIVGAIGNALNFFPNMIAQVVKAVASFLGGIFGVNNPTVGTAPPATTSLAAAEAATVEAGRSRQSADPVADTTEPAGHDSPARAEEETAAAQAHQPIDERKHDEPVKQVEEQVPAEVEAVNEVVNSKLPTTDAETSVGEDADEDTSPEPKTVAKDADTGTTANAPKTTSSSDSDDAGSSPTGGSTDSAGTASSD